MDKMKDLAYYNGKITAIDDMMIPANDRGFYFGDGIYEAAMVFDHKIFALQDHLDRMFNREQLPVSLLAGDQRNLSAQSSVPGKGSFQQSVCIQQAVERCTDVR